MPFHNCTSVSSACPIEATTYGYRPSLSPNVALLAVFVIVLICQLVFVLRYRLWSYSFVVAAGCVFEAVGYIGRLQMHNNPWSDGGFRIQIICLTFAPSLLAAGIYVTLKHLVTYFGLQYSRLRPKLYTWIFIGCDLVSIIMQAGGAGIAVSASTNAHPNKTLAETGNSIMLAGIAFQVATMIICGLLAAEFVFLFKRSTRLANAGEMPQARNAQPKALCFCGAVVVAYVTILIRCIYRLPEMAGVFGGPLMRNEAEFLVLDGLMVAIASVSLTVFYPGIFFPGMLEGKPAGSKSNSSIVESKEATT